MSIKSSDPAQRAALYNADFSLIPYGGGVPFRIGQISLAEVQPTFDDFKLKDYTTGGGGLAERLVFVTGGTLTMTALSSVLKNIALAVMGSTSAVTSESVTGEAATAYPGNNIVLLLGMATSTATTTVTVSPPAWQGDKAYALGDLVRPTTGTHFYRCTTAGTSSVTESEPTWKTDGTTTSDGSTLKWADMGLMVLQTGEFQVRSKALFILADVDRIPATGAPVTVDYARPASHSVQAATSTGQEFQVIAAGVDRNTGKNFRAVFLRVNFAGAEKLAMISDKPIEHTFKAELMVDATVEGDDLSKVFYIEYED